MRVNVHVGHAPDAVPPAQGLDRYADVVEYAKSRDDTLKTFKGGTDHGRGRLVYAGKCRGVAAVEKSRAAERLSAHPRDVIGRVKRREVFRAARNRRRDIGFSVQALVCECPPEGVQTIGAEGMTPAESVGRQCRPVVNPHTHAPIISYQP